MHDDQLDKGKIPVAPPTPLVNARATIFFCQSGYGIWRRAQKDRSRNGFFGTVARALRPAPRYLNRNGTWNTTNWLPKIMRKDYVVGLTGQGGGVDPTSVST